MAELHVGDAVEVFFRMGRDEHGSFPVTDRYSATLRPRVSFTDCWVRAHVLQEWPPRAKTASCAEQVHVCYTHPSARRIELARRAQHTRPAVEYSYQARFRPAVCGPTDKASS